MSWVSGEFAHSSLRTHRVTDTHTHTNQAASGIQRTHKHITPLPSCSFNDTRRVSNAQRVTKGRGGTQEREKKERARLDAVRLQPSYLCCAVVNEHLPDNIALALPQTEHGADGFALADTRERDREGKRGRLVRRNREQVPKLPWVPVDL